jgi:hypothetical protein
MFVICVVGYLLQLVSLDCAVVHVLFMRILWACYACKPSIDKIRKIFLKLGSCCKSAGITDKLVLCRAAMLSCGGINT